MAPVLRSQGSAESPVEAGPSTPHIKEARVALCRLLELPHELLERAALAEMDWKALCALASTCTQLRCFSEDCALWRREWERVYGEVGAVQEVAAAKAGSFKALFAARYAALKEAEPWLKPSSYEVQASVDMLAAPMPQDALAAGEGKGEAMDAARDQDTKEEGTELCLVFLVDGSGSVTEEDFRVMTDFMLQAVRSVAGGGGDGNEAAAAAPPVRSKVAVIQFSNDVRVEQGPLDVDVAAFAALMGGMVRMNGGTNIALAVQKAGQLLKPLSAATRRVLVLLTDGRIDSHQSREARDMAARLGDEQANVRVHAYGVGRGVDKQELLRICAARDAATAEDRYLGLMVLDEAPW